MKPLNTLLLTIGLFGSGLVAAAQPNDIPSCYDITNLAEHKAGLANRQLIVIVDQTAELDDRLKKSVHEQVDQFIQPGDQVQIVAFSANAKGKYTEILYNGIFDAPLAARTRNSIGKTTLNRFDACMQAQPQAKAKLHRKLREAYGDETETFPKTELIGSLLQVGSNIIANSPSERKVLLIVSDMLENSSITSFYASNRVRQIDPTVELQKIVKSGISGDLGGADVYVIGAGFVGKGMAYSSQLALDNLEAFWRELFSQHNGTLQQFGKPQLLSPIK